MHKRGGSGTARGFVFGLLDCTEKKIGLEIPQSYSKSGKKMAISGILGARARRQDFGKFGISDNNRRKSP